MQIRRVFESYFHYLIHPFHTHEAFTTPSYEGFKPMKLTAYQSLATSWVFVMISGLTKILLTQVAIITVFELISNDSYGLTNYINFNEIPSFYFVVLSATLDVIFYPLFGIFLIQFWEVIIRLYGRGLETPGDLTQKAHDIMSVSFSSSIFLIVPMIGGAIQGLVTMFLMYAGLRVQLKSSPVLSICILFTPFVIIMGFIAMIMMLATLFII